MMDGIERHPFHLEMAHNCLLIYCGGEPERPFETSYPQKKRA
jgi:hypothetical protein